MSGCCGQSPVIQAPTPARVDVEALLMCDVLTDGTVAGRVLVEPIYDTILGERVGTRTVDPATGDPYTVQGELTPCPVSSDCAEETTPAATVGLCLADGTPIAVTVTRDCTAAVTSEGWLNLVTGAWSAGAPPAGTVACGESRSIQVSGTFCDVLSDGEVAGLILIEYSYAADGSIDAVRLVDATTGTTYAPQGEVTTCPADMEQPEQDVVQLCDVQADGSVTAFIRDYRRDENGTITGYSDYALGGAAYTPSGQVGACGAADAEVQILCDTATDGAVTTFLRRFEVTAGGAVSHVDTLLDGTTAYAPAGTVGVCATPPAECEAAAVQAFRLCDLNPAVAEDANGLRCATPFLRHFVYACDGTSAFHDTAMDGVTPYTPVQVVECGENPPSLREQVWNTLSIAPDPADTTNRVFIYTVANSEDPTQTGTVKMTASKAYGGGCGGTATAPVWNAAVTFTFEPDAAVLAKADVLRVDAIDWDTWEDVVIPSGSPLPNKIESVTGHTQVSSGRWHSTISNNTGHFYFNGPPSVVRMSHRNDGGGNACVAPSFGFITLVPGPPCGVVPEVDHIVQPLCDVAAAGTSTPFLRHWTVNNATGLLTPVQDTTLNGTTAYMTTGTVTVCGQQPDQPVLTGVRRVTGTTVVQNLKTEFPGLQSVSMTVVAGAVNAAMSSGTSQPVPAGASVTWSVSDTDDSSLAAAAFGGVTAAADFLLVWTYKAGAAG
ncbi:hypothetical protein [Streptomyces sp. NPDC056291]|uniref:hypothetical protein n=1 Tax=Streptomyces sp. NPDC056291 TaxID=3345772 RepID=UPI0035DCAD84